MPEAEERSSPLVRQADPLLEVAENALYALAGVVLVAGAAAVLVEVAYGLVTTVADGTIDAVTTALDGLLLIFILLELLAAVRATMVQQQLVAEPFLIVGIIASIKEIVVTALKAQDLIGAEDGAFDDAMIKIGVLGVVVVLLSVSVLLVRRKEREPEE